MDRTDVLDRDAATDALPEPAAPAPATPPVDRSVLMHELREVLGSAKGTAGQTSNDNA